MLSISNLIWNSPEGEPIINGVDLEIPDGKLVVVTGPNGGGKTTLAKLIAGIEKPTSGKLILDGKDITDLDITQRARCGVSYAFQQPVRFKGISVRDLMELAAGGSLSHNEMCDLLAKVGLCAREYMDREINASLSGGEIKRIEIATVLARGTRFMLFDEPEAGIDLWSFTGLIDVFNGLRRSLDGSLVIISHQERILSIADEIVVLANGKVQKKGPGSEILPELLGKTSGCERCPTKEVRL